MLHTLIVSALLGFSAAQDTSLISPKNGPFKEVPLLGFGTWNLANGENGTEAVASAIEAGYRHIDCATVYNNQKAVGKGIAEGLKRTGLQRSDLWITSKLWSDRHGSQVKSGIDINLQQLGLEYLDMALIHFPVGNVNGKAEYDIVPTWKEMEKYTGEGKPLRYIGVSNFNVPQMNELLAAATIKPKAHQLETHPYLQQTSFVQYHKEKGVLITAYAPLGNTNPSYAVNAMRAGAPGPLLKDPVLQKIATARGCTVAQVSLKWNMDRGIVVHPKTLQVARQKENFEAYTKCQLTAEDTQQINALDKKFRFWNPCQMFGLPCYKGLDGM